MKKMSLITTTGVILLAAPFMAATADTSLDDAYLYENSGAFNSPVAGSHDIQKSDVSIDDMYAWEQRDSYEFSSSGPTSSEQTEIAVFSEVSIELEPTALPSYTGEYE